MSSKKKTSRKSPIRSGRPKVVARKKAKKKAKKAVSPQSVRLKKAAKKFKVDAGKAFDFAFAKIVAVKKKVGEEP